MASVVLFEAAPFGIVVETWAAAVAVPVVGLVAAELAWPLQWLVVHPWRWLELRVL